jgi:hypothetical protein
MSVHADELKTAKSKHLTVVDILNFLYSYAIIYLTCGLKAAGTFEKIVQRMWF